MFQIIEKENGKNAVKNIDDNRVIRNFRVAAYQIMQMKNLTIDELAKSIFADPTHIKKFLTGDPTYNGELAKSICERLNLDEIDYLPQYFQSNKINTALNTEKKKSMLTKLLNKLIQPRPCNVIVTTELLKWTDLKVKLEKLLNRKIEQQTPYCVEWENILLEPHKLIEGKYYIDELIMLIQSIRRNPQSNRLLVIKIDSNDFFIRDKEEIISSNELIIERVYKLKRIIIENYIIV